MDAELSGRCRDLERQLDAERRQHALEPLGRSNDKSYLRLRLFFMSSMFGEPTCLDLTPDALFHGMRSPLKCFD